ncbi:MAG: hypothetical protein AAGI63_17285 [Planctomycetota bacterium]
MIRFNLRHCIGVTALFALTLAYAGDNGLLYRDGAWKVIAIRQVRPWLEVATMVDGGRVKRLEIDPSSSAVVQVGSEYVVSDDPLGGYVWSPRERWRDVFFVLNGLLALIASAAIILFFALVVRLPQVYLDHQSLRAEDLRARRRKRIV